MAEGHTANVRVTNDAGGDLWDTGVCRKGTKARPIGKKGVGCVSWSGGGRGHKPAMMKMVAYVLQAEWMVNSWHCCLVLGTA
jgi:hypothetical protein